MLSLINATKFYKTPKGRKVILDNVSIDIECERGVAILGMNGAGKSTLVRLLSGTELLNSGEIKRTGGRISWPMGLAGTFQPSMTGTDNVRFAAQIYGQDPDQVVTSVKEFADLGDYMDMNVGTYSNGMRSRLAFGLSLAVSFDIYLIDEIISVGDRLFKHKSKQMLQEHIQGSKIFLVSHQEDTVREFCDKCILLRSGNIEFFEDMDEAFHTFNNIKTR